MRDYLKEFLYSYHWDPSKALVRAIEARLISSFELKGPVLDMGCGDGVFASVLLPGEGVVGLDVGHRKIADAGKRRFYSGLLVSDAGKAAFKDGVFNSVLVNSILEHIPGTELEDVLSEAKRVLNTKGRMIITLNNARFGAADPVVKSLRKLGLHGFAGSWERYRMRRLALASLKEYSYWVALFRKMNLRVVESRAYLPANSEKTFFVWTYVQYLGIGKFNLGVVLRSFSKVLSFLGVNAHRRMVASVFGKILRKGYLAESGEGSCHFFVLEKD